MLWLYCFTGKKIFVLKESKNAEKQDAFILDPKMSVSLHLYST